MNIANFDCTRTYASIPAAYTQFLVFDFTRIKYASNELFQIGFESSISNMQQTKAVLVLTNSANNSVETIFREYYDNWYNDTKYLTSPKMFENKHYRDIISLGSSVVPSIIKKLREEPAHLFEALVEITGQDPVPESHWGDIEQMTSDWIMWWKEKNCVQN